MDHGPDTLTCAALIKVNTRNRHVMNVRLQRTLQCCHLTLWLQKHKTKAPAFKTGARNRRSYLCKCMHVCTLVLSE